MDKKRIIEMTEEEQALDWVKDLVKEIDDTGNPLAVSRLNIGIKNLRAKAEKEKVVVEPEIVAPLEKGGNTNGGALPTTAMQMAMAQLEHARSNLFDQRSVILNVFAKTQIFEISKSKERRKNEKITLLCVIGDVKIYHEGEMLNQDDLTGVLMLIKLAGKNLIAKLDRKEFLLSLNKKWDPKNRAWLEGFIHAVTKSTFQIDECDPKDHKKVITRRWGPLALAGVETNIHKNNSTVELLLFDPLIKFLGIDKGWSYIDMNKRFELTSHIALAFQAFTSINKCPKSGYWWTKEEFMKTWGSEDSKNITSFFKNLKSRVLKQLLECRVIRDFEIRDTSIGVWW